VRAQQAMLSYEGYKITIAVLCPYRRHREKPSYNFGSRARLTAGRARARIHKSGLSRLMW
jgi:hypothetical protein